MTYQIAQGIQVSLDGSTWYKLSDHNRQPIDITYNLIEATDRMANGTLRKFIVARKFIIAADWTDFPTLDENLVDTEYVTSSITAIAGDGTSVVYTVTGAPAAGTSVYITGSSVVGFNGRYIVSSATENSFTISNKTTGTATTASVTYPNPNSAKAAAWIKAFYEGNYGNPVYVKLIFAKEGHVQNSIPDGVYLDSKNSTGQVFTAFMTTFSYNIKKRRTAQTNKGFDYVDLKIEFTEV